jgi:hypothetical protein
LDTAAGSTVTLPPATGSGMQVKFIVTVVPTEGNVHTIRVGRAADVMCGIVRSMDDTSANLVAFAAAADSDTITLDPAADHCGGTTVGEHLELEDIAANLWHVSGVLSNTGDPATPFSATVS